jgi:hypothetical protein
MTKHPGIDAALLDYNDHRGGDVELRHMRVEGCLHFQDFVTACMSHFHSSDSLAAFVALQSQELDRQALEAIALLSEAGLPDGWIPAIKVVMMQPFEVTLPPVPLVSVLYVELERRIFGSPPQTREGAIQLAFLAAGATGLDYWYWDKTDWIHAIPTPNIDLWWPRCQALVDAYVSAEDLRRVSTLNGGGSDVEALSAVTAPGRLVELYQTWSGSAVAANPNLPREFVHEEMVNDVNLIFHPSADIERAWSVLEEILMRDPWVLEGISREFEDMLNDDWFQMSRFAVDSDQAVALKQRAAGWSQLNIEDEVERRSVMDLLGYSG